MSLHPTSPPRYEKVRKLFLTVCELDPLERSAILDEACAGDTDLRRDVESLLKEDMDTAGSLPEEARPGGFIREVVESRQTRAAVQLPQTLGRYRLLRVVGHGGMATVYEAEQDHPRRTVALKVLQPGIASESMIRRFEFEARVLGLLQHPGIAQIHDAGTADTVFGTQPFFAMELIRGRPLLDYAREHQLSIRQRLELLAEICDAVQHAHTRGVIHRDLKPGNILVDESGRAKVLDFGVARVTDADIKTTTLHTRMGQLVGTVAYMSPEQAAGDADGIDTRSDVYALGVIGYELLTGRLPYKLDHIELHEAVRVIRHDEPTKAGQINRAWRGDVETILSTALEKAKERRYQTVAALAADIRRQLNDEPIAARPAGAVYQFRKFARRHRPLVVAAIALAATFLAGMGGTAYGLLVALRERDNAVGAKTLADDRLAKLELSQAEANREGEKAHQVLNFLTDMLAAGNPSSEGRRDITVREVLDQAASTVEAKFPDSPDVQASVEHTIGKTYSGLGLYDEALPHLRSSVRLHRAIYGDGDMKLRNPLTNLGHALRSDGQLDEAGKVFQEVCEMLERAKGREDHQTLIALGNLANVWKMRSRFADSERLNREIVDTRLRVFGLEHPQTLGALTNLGALYTDAGRLEEAEPILRRACEAARAAHLDPLRLVTIEKNLAVVLSKRGSFDEAEMLLRRTAGVRENQLGPEHSLTLTTLADIALLLNSQRKYDESRAICIRVAEAQIRTLGEDHLDTIVTRALLASLQRTMGEFDEAERSMKGVIDSCLRVWGTDHAKTVRNMANLAALYNAQSRYEEAVRIAGESVVIGERVFPNDSLDLALVRGHYGVALMGTDDLAGAKEQLVRSLQVAESQLGIRHERTQKLVEVLVQVLAKLGDAEAAAGWKAKLHTAENGG